MQSRVFLSMSKCSAVNQHAEILLNIFWNWVENKWTLTALHMKAFSEHPPPPQPRSSCKTTTAGIIRELYFENIGLHGNEGTTQSKKKLQLSLESCKKTPSGFKAHFEKKRTTVD